MVDASEEWCGFESQVIKSVTNTGSNPVLTSLNKRLIERRSSSVQEAGPANSQVAKLVRRCCGATPLYKNSISPYDEVQVIGYRFESCPDY